MTLTNKQLNKRIAMLHGNKTGKQNATINILMQSQDPLLRPLQEDIAKLGRGNISWNSNDNMDIKHKIVLAAEKLADPAMMAKYHVWQPPLRAHPWGHLA